MKLLAGVFVGAILGVLSMLLLFVAPVDLDISNLVWVFFPVWAAAIVVSVKAKSASSAWHKLLLSASMGAFILFFSAWWRLSIEHYRVMSDVFKFMTIAGLLGGLFFLVVGTMVGRGRDWLLIR